jgi:gliding motility-associated-like protein
VDTLEYVYIFSETGSVTQDTLFTCAFYTLNIGYLTTDSFSVVQWLPNPLILSTTNTQATINASNNQVFTLYLSNGQCADTVYFPLIADFLELDATNDTVICQNTQINLNAIINGSFTELIWSSNNQFLDTLQTQISTFNPVISGDSAFFIKTKIRGCEKIDSVFIQHEGIRINKLGEDICYNDLATIEIVNLENNHNLSITWLPSSDILNSLNSLIINLKQDFNQLQYPFFLENQYRCILNDTAKIERVGPMPNNTQLTVNEDTVQINSNVIFNLTTGNYGFEWFPNNLFTPGNLSQTISVSGNFTATVIVTDTLTGCRLERSIPITVYELKCNDEQVFVPNAFTPNGDGENDVVAVRSRIVKDIYFTIYNKWGEQVFETTKTNHGWDGTYKGRLADPGVFVYYIKGTCIDNQNITLKGNITLIR